MTLPLPPFGLCVSQGSSLPFRILPLGSPSVIRDWGARLPHSEQDRAIRQLSSGTRLTFSSPTAHLVQNNREADHFSPSFCTSAQASITAMEHSTAFKRLA